MMASNERAFNLDLVTERPNGDTPRGIVAVDIYPTYIIVHLVGGRWYQQTIPSKGVSVTYSSFYGSMKIQPEPYKQVK